MIDPTLPMELDSGQEVTLVGVSNNCIRVRVAEGPYRDSQWNTSSHAGLTWSYDQRTGVFGGGDPNKFLVLRNGITAPEEYEDWFV